MADAFVYGYTRHPAPFFDDDSLVCSWSPWSGPQIPFLSSWDGSESEQIEEPVGPDDNGSQGLGPLPQFAIRCDESDRLIGCLCHDIDERVIAAALGMHDRHAIGETTRHTLASLALEDHDDRLVRPPRLDSCSYLFHEGARCPGSIPPPTGWTRSDHIGCVDNEHGPSLLRYETDLR